MLGQEVDLIHDILTTVEGWPAVVLVAIFLGFRTYLVHVEDRKMRIIESICTDRLEQLSKVAYSIEQSVSALAREVQVLSASVRAFLMRQSP